MTIINPRITYPRSLRRLLIDVHIPDWDGHFLAEFNPALMAEEAVASGADLVVHQPVPQPLALLTAGAIFPGVVSTLQRRVTEHVGTVQKRLPPYSGRLFDSPKMLTGKRFRRQV